MWGTLKTCASCVSTAQFSLYNKSPKQSPYLSFLLLKIIQVEGKVLGRKPGRAPVWFPSYSFFWVCQRAEYIIKPTSNRKSRFPIPTKEKKDSISKLFLAAATFAEVEKLKNAKPSVLLAMIPPSQLHASLSYPIQVQKHEEDELLWIMFPLKRLPSVDIYVS